MLVWACDRIARSTRHFLEILDELNRLNVEFVSFREQIDTGGPLGRAIMVIIGAVAELERNLIIERVRARLEGRSIGRPSLEIDRAAIVRDRQLGRSLGQLAKAYSVSGPPSTVCFRSSRNVRPPPEPDVFQKGPENDHPNLHKINGRISPIRPFQKGRI